LREQIENRNIAILYLMYHAKHVLLERNIKNERNPRRFGVARVILKCYAFKTKIPRCLGVAKKNSRRLGVARVVSEKFNAFKTRASVA
jgi:hypothetical protein